MARMHFNRIIPAQSYFAILPTYTVEGTWCWLKDIWREGSETIQGHITWTYFENKPIRVRIR